MLAANSFPLDFGGSIYQVNDSVSPTYVAALFLTISQPQYLNSGYDDTYGTGSPLIYSAIDKKIDDGIVRTGKFKAHRPWAGIGNCLTGVGGVYDLTETRETCMGEFIIAK